MVSVPIFDTGISPDDCLLHSMVYPEKIWDGKPILDWHYDFWTDPERLRNFFVANDALLQSDFWTTRCMTRSKAIRQVKEETDEFFDLLLEIDHQFSQTGKAPALHDLFKPLHKYEHGGSPYQYKAKPRPGRLAPLLRLYGLKLTSGQIVITGGGIKLTKTMGGETGMPSLQAELYRIQQVKDYILQHRIEVTGDFLTVA